MGGSKSKDVVALREENLLEKLSKMNERQAQMHQQGMREMRDMYISQQDTNFRMLGTIMEEARRKEERRLEESRRAGERNKYFAIGLIVIAFFASQSSLESTISLNSLVAITCVLGALVIFVQQKL